MTHAGIVHLLSDVGAIMKRWWLIRYGTIACAWVTLLYGLWAFAEWDVNAANWGFPDRMFFSFFAFFGLLMSAMAAVNEWEHSS